MAENKLLDKVLRQRGIYNVEIFRKSLSETPNTLRDGDGKRYTLSQLFREIEEAARKDEHHVMAERLVALHFVKEDANFVAAIKADEQTKVLKEILWVIDNWFEYTEGENMHPIGMITISREINTKEITRLKNNIKEAIGELNG